MASPIKTFVLLLLILSLYSSSGNVEGFGEEANTMHELYKVHMKMRKLKVIVDAGLDYDYGGPNPRHEPRKGKPGGGNHP